MPAHDRRMISRRGFMKLSAATAASLAADKPRRVLHALVAAESDSGRRIRAGSLFSL